MARGLQRRTPQFSLWPQSPTPGLREGLGGLGQKETMPSWGRLPFRGHMGRGEGSQGAPACPEAAPTWCGRPAGPGRPGCTGRSSQPAPRRRWPYCPGRAAWPAASPAPPSAAAGAGAGCRCPGLGDEGGGVAPCDRSAGGLAGPTRPPGRASRKRGVLPLLSQGEGASRVPPGPSRPRPPPPRSNDPRFLAFQ